MILGPASTTVCTELCNSGGSCCPNRRCHRHGRCRCQKRRKLQDLVLWAGGSMFRLLVLTFGASAATQEIVVQVWWQGSEKERCMAGWWNQPPTSAGTLQPSNILCSIFVKALHACRDNGHRLAVVDMLLESASVECKLECLSSLCRLEVEEREAVAAATFWVHRKIEKVVFSQKPCGVDPFYQLLLHKRRGDIENHHCGLSFKGRIGW